MSEIELQPTRAIDDGLSWYDPSAALLASEYSAKSLGGGVLALLDCYGRSHADPRNFVSGFRIEVRGKALATPISLDSFSATAGTLLRAHDGEVEADWQRPTTAYKPTDLKVSSLGSLYFTFENEDGYSSNGSEHFLSNFDPETSDYSVQAVFYAASVVPGAKAELYARATAPFSYYFLQYVAGSGWSLGKRTVSGDRTILGTYVGDEIAAGSSRLAKIVAEGTSIKGYIDGVLRISVTNSQIGGKGYPGLRIDAPASMSEPKVTVTALYDLGSAQRVTRYRLKFGTVNNNTWANAIEASNDGVTWVNAATLTPPQGIGSGSFFWEGEWDSSGVTSTNYRYWRAVVYDGGTPNGGEARIADFRLYDSGGALISVGGAVSTRYTYRQGSSAGNWSEGTSTSLFSDGSPGSTATYVGGLPPYDYDLRALHIDDFRVDRVVPSNAEACLTVNGETPTGSYLPVLLSDSYSWVEVGGDEELFGRAWAASDIDSPTFGVMLKRSSSGIELYIDAVRVIMIYTPSGGIEDMVPRELAQQVTTIGHEATFGEDLAATTVRLRHTRILPTANPEFLTATAQGEKLSTHEIVVAEMSDGAIGGTATYDEIGYLLASIIGKPTTVALSGTDAYQHTFTFNNRAKNARNSYNLEHGDFNRAHKIKAMLVSALSLTQQTKSIDLGGSIIAGKLIDGITPSRGAASVQTITQSGTGTFKLGYKGEFTSALTAGGSLTASDIQTALRALTGISSTQLTVTGSNGGPFTVTFGNSASGPFKGIPQPVLDVLVASGSPSVSIANTTPGGFTTYPGHVINPRHLSVYLTDVLADIASSKLAGSFVNSINMSNFFTPLWENDRAKESFSGYAENPEPEVKFGLTINADSNGMSWLPKGRSNTLLYKRLEWIGANIASTSVPFKLQIDCPVKVSNYGQYGENEDVYAHEYEFSAKQDDSTGKALVIILVNQVASYLGS